MSMMNCVRLSRRQWLTTSAAASASMWATGSFREQLARAATTTGRPHKACILLWMSGGPSQLETLDPKPGHRNGGPTRAIATNVPGIAIADNLPGMASVADKLAIIRSMSTREGDHGRATALMTGGHPVTGVMDQPHLGSIIAHRAKRGLSPSALRQHHAQ